MNKAGHHFKCIICDEVHIIEKAQAEHQLGGPMCPACLRLCRWSEAYLKKAKIVRPIAKQDITAENHKRFL